MKMLLTYTHFVCVALLAFVYDAQGLEFTISRNPGNQFCGHLRCQINTDRNDQSIFSIVSMTIYDVAQAAAKSKVASISVSVSAPELYVDPARSDVINASGSVSRYHADLSLDLKKTSDCLNVTYQCELEFMNLSGQLDSQEQTLEPPKDDCSGDLAQKAADLSNRTEQLENELRRLNDKYKDLETKLNSLLGQHTALPTDTPATAPTHEPATIPTHQSSTETTQTPATTQTQTNPGTRSGCAPGMSLDQPREKFTLEGNIQAMCDTETDGGGWIIIQRRTTGDVDFYKGWDDYKNGFGTPDTDFWLGNDVIHGLASQGYTQLRVDMTYEDRSAFAQYSIFDVGDEISKYKLTVGGFSGTAGDNLSYHSGMGFTTFDQDNDQFNGINCAEDYHGAWWYKDCYESNLNGEWGTDTGNAMIWNKFVLGKSLSSSEIKVRHV